MAISTKTISDTINWAKRFTFNRNPVIGNSLEPALTSAQMVMQTILSPPFEFWWNNEELVFTCNPVPNSATSTVVSVAGGIVTVTAPTLLSWKSRPPKEPSHAHRVERALAGSRDRVNHTVHCLSAGCE